MRDRIASDPQSLTDVLRFHAAVRPERPALTFCRGATPASSLSFGELDLRVRTFAAALQERGLAGERALLVFPPGEDYVVAFLGCLYAGVVAVPAYPPEPHRLEHSLRRLQSIVRDAQTRAVVTTDEILGFARSLLADTLADLGQLDWLTVPEPEPSAAAGWRAPRLERGSLAFLQYTSGSTSAPKGVMVSHGNVLHNAAMLDACAGGREHKIACWLPLYHDMGLIANLLFSLYVGGELFLMSPFDFLRRPLSWLELISQAGVTTTIAPNFAFDLCVRKVTPAERDALDLSCLRDVVASAEPVHHGTVERFLEYFAPCGLERDVFQASYGLAEATVFVTGRASRAGRPSFRTVRAGALERNRVVGARPGEEGALTLTACGGALLDTRVIVVDPETRDELGDEDVGEIWISGAHVAQGYWNDPERTARTFGARLATGDGPFLRTGDLGFLSGGELVVTGRMSDLMIVRGRNLHPHDLERTVSATRPRCPEVRPGCTAVFSVERGGGEAVVAFVEVDPARNPSFDPRRTVEAVRGALASEWAVEVHAVVLLARGTLPKTSSGKLMRRSCRRAFLEGFAASAVRVLHQDVLPERPEPRTTERAGDEGAPLPVAAWLTQWVSRALGLAPGELDGSAPITSLGVDSVLAVDLIADIERSYGVLLPETLLWDHETFDELADHLRSQLAEEALA